MSLWSNNNPGNLQKMTWFLKHIVFYSLNKKQAGNYFKRRFRSAWNEERNQALQIQGLLHSPSIEHVWNLVTWDCIAASRTASVGSIKMTQNKQMHRTISDALLWRSMITQPKHANDNLRLHSANSHLL